MLDTTLYSLNSGPRGPIFLEVKLRTLLPLQANVFKQMSAPIRERHPLPVNGRISDLSYFVPMFSAEDWTSALAAAHDTMVHESAALYVSSRGLLDAMKTVLGSFSSLELLYHTTWWFLEQIGTFTSNRLYAAATATLGAQGRLYLKVMCAAQVSLLADNVAEVIADGCISRGGWESCSTQPFLSAVSRPAC
ncbi:hypothetical protein HPB51_017811 [Rhipicephalus microplus]|uniref:Uncharacterized protein n=1 Tax=Rhipicephalus microplus TaxID=6941 RepID=A0A9J6DWN4_RHIMP|nr:hypothetical protein HPB51_017811 [Rhipicephalus microplus]